MNKNFTKQYINTISIITDGLDHKKAISVLKDKLRMNLIDKASLTGYEDAIVGNYDKYWRYSTNKESEYLMGVQAALNNGAVINNYIEVEYKNGFK